eukprot:1136726-Pelagomonas_calceolata.AAC.1
MQYVDARKRACVILCCYCSPAHILCNNCCAAYISHDTCWVSHASCRSVLTRVYKGLQWWPTARDSG